MRIWTSLLIATPVAVGLLAAPAAHADWHNQGGGWHGGYQQHYRGGGGYYGGGGGNAVAGALVGLGVGALIGGAIASQAYAPPPAYYPPPGYYAPPTYTYYGQPTYYAPPGY